METTQKEEFTRVQRVTDRKYNLITANGKLLSEQWFDWVDYFHEGFAIVREDYLMNFINKQGKLLSNEWFEYVDDFDKYGLAIVYRTNGEQCKIDKTGKIVVRK